MAESVVMIINNPPYGNEEPWNALRLAKALVAVKHKILTF
jgi:sulfur relay (sulfurtransferase) complex TusBCD TusD component (DsrE family)